MQLIRQYSLYIAWLIALVGMVGSLYAQYVLGQEPCVLCWWQRIFLYPLVIVIPISIIRKDGGAWMYGLPLALLGTLVAIYHSLLYMGIVSEALAPCSIGVPCTQALPALVGPLNIIGLSVIAFICIIALLYTSRTNQHKQLS